MRRARAHLPSTVAALVALGGAGCGLGLWDEEPGGSANLPTLGAGAYRRLGPDIDTPGDEPWVIDDRFETFSDPAPLARAGGGLRVWFGWAAQDQLGSTIGYAELSSVHDLPVVAPRVVLTPSAAWEQGRIGAPAIADLGDGHLVMFYEGGDVATPAIGRADSTDDGDTWSRGDAPVLTDAAQPTVAVLDGQLVLFVTRPGEVGIFRTELAAATATAFTLRPEPVIVPRPELADAFDAVEVGSPFALITVSQAGRAHWGLWFTGAAEAPDAGAPPTAVGYAGSFDGDTWERFGGPDPVLGSNAFGPAVVLDGATGVMLFHDQHRLQLGIAAAVHP
ncbi:MAG: hypothetical protein H6708_13840 [Kofleriaceae bacterium]|nr:hypothetical protein [Myxococcales bacterium]MCB9561483.1 hypothetical protein [Kofleriaceae bacterium]